MRSKALSKDIQQSDRQIWNWFRLHRVNQKVDSFHKQQNGLVSFILRTVKAFQHCYLGILQQVFNAKKAIWKIMMFVSLLFLFCCMQPWISFGQGFPGDYLPDLTLFFQNDSRYVNASFTNLIKTYITLTVYAGAMQVTVFFFLMETPFFLWYICIDNRIVLRLTKLHQVEIWIFTYNYRHKNAGERNT